MNRILTGLLALILFGQATTFSALNDIQAGGVDSIVGNILEGHHFMRTKFDDITSSAFLLAGYGASGRSVESVSTNGILSVRP